jgi:hypothetical protein
MGSFNISVDTAVSLSAGITGGTEITGSAGVTGGGGGITGGDADSEGTTGGSEEIIGASVIVLFPLLFSETDPDGKSSVPLSVSVFEVFAGTLAGDDLQEVITRNNESKIHTEKIFLFIYLLLNYGKEKRHFN